MVLGAGRGPLVNASLRAAKQADRKLRIYAVEKNPNAVVTWVEPFLILNPDLQKICQHWLNSFQKIIKVLHFFIQALGVISLDSFNTGR